MFPYHLPLALEQPWTWVDCLFAVTYVGDADAGTLELEQNRKIYSSGQVSQPKDTDDTHSS
eukprot:scaffold1714_cov78-Skeletonema_dohrnii-CCMP3373.AAC.2